MSLPPESDTPKNIPTLRIQLWLETEDGQYFGMGRAQLLERIRAHGSLKKAAAEMGMSYRAAWGKIRRTESVMGEKIIRRSGTRRDGHELTPFGTQVMESYNEWFNAVEEDALRLAHRMFPWRVKRYPDSRTPAETAPPASRRER